MGSVVRAVPTDLRWFPTYRVYRSRYGLVARFPGDVLLKRIAFRDIGLPAPRLDRADSP